VGRKQERGTLSPRPLHVPLSLDALPDAPGVRRAERRLLLRPPRAVEYSVAGSDDVERNHLHRGRARVGADDGERRRSDRRFAIGIRLPQSFDEETYKAGIGGIDRIIEQATRTICGGRIESGEAGGERSRQIIRLAERRENG